MHSMFLLAPPVKNRLMATANKIQYFLFHAPKKGKIVNSQKGKKENACGEHETEKEGSGLKEGKHVGEGTQKEH